MRSRMANNPITHNTGGINRFQDYISQIPEFLREEDDVVTLLQFLSDYINNAYRNITTVEKFEFTLITSDSQLIIVKNRLQKLIDLFRACESKSIPVNYLSLPQYPIIQSIEFAGTYSSLNISAVTVPWVNGQCVYVKFTHPDYISYTGEYIIDTGALQPAPNSTSQDPFNDTPNEPYVDFFGITARMLQFKVSDISDIKMRNIGEDAGVIYYSVFFEASLNEMKNIPSIYTVDDKYIVDYYNQLMSIPSGYQSKYSITYAPSCDTLDMDSIPKGIFYARELTQFTNDNIFKNIKSDTLVVDPIYSEVSALRNIEFIDGNGTRVTVTTKEPHRLSIGEEFTISSNVGYDGTFIVLNVVDAFTVEYSSTTMSGELGGILVIKNLYMTKLYDESSYSIYVPYTGLDATSEFAVNDLVARVVEVDSLYYETFNASMIDTSSYALVMSNTTSFKTGDEVVFRISADDNGGSLVNPVGIVGLSIGDIKYTVSNVTTNKVYLNGISLSTVSAGVYRMYKVSGTKYFNSYTDINDNKISLPSTTIRTLNAGYTVTFTGSVYDESSVSMVELPSPLIENHFYEIDTVDYVNNTITLKDVMLVNAPIAKQGYIQIARVDYSRIDMGKVSNVRIYTPLDSGRLTIASFRGDLLSSGKLAKIKSGSMSNVMTVDTNTLPWNSTSTYKKDDLVIYSINGLRYKVIKAVDGTKDATVPPSSKNYVLYMNDLTEHKKSVLSNPYMFGIYEVKPMGYDEQYDISEGNTSLSKRLIIKKKQNIAMDIGTDQKEWIFDPRIAPPEVLTRNGYLELFIPQLSLTDHQVIYCKKNLFDVTDVNPITAKGSSVNITSMDITSNIATIVTDTVNGFTTDTVFEFVGDIDPFYKRRFQVTSILNSNSFTVTLPMDTYPSSITGDIACVAEKYYKYTIDWIQWQKKGIHNPAEFTESDVNTKHVIASNDNKDNVWSLNDSYLFTLDNGTKIRFKDGDIVVVNDQLISSEQGNYYKVVENNRWRKLDKKLAMKIREMNIESYENLSYDGRDTESVPFVYRTYSDTEVSGIVVSDTNVGNFQFFYEKVDNIDTTQSYEQIYDARKDKNSVAPRDDMDSTFAGIPDMGYPLVEKIERLKYLKDPNIIDLELISYLSKFMGYDITLLGNDISENAWYNSDVEVEKAIRRAVQQLPQFYTLKATESGLSLLMKVFGIIGELVTLWTRDENAYDVFIEDYKLRQNQYQDMENNVNSTWVPTPHFKIMTNVEGNYANTFLPDDFKRLNMAIQSYKPINTVFRGAILYLNTLTKSRISISRMAGKGSMKCSIGYNNLVWTAENVNDCF